MHRLIFHSAFRSALAVDVSQCVEPSPSKIHFRVIIHHFPVYFFYQLSRVKL